VRRRREEEVVERGGAREHREAGGREASLTVARGVYSREEWGKGRGAGGGRKTRGWRRAEEPYLRPAGGLYQVFLPGVLGCRISNFEFSDDV
jgi:hypothetical protein